MAIYLIEEVLERSSLLSLDGLVARKRAGASLLVGGDD